MWQCDKLAVRISVSHIFLKLYNNRNTFIVPTDAHYYKIIEMLKQFKIIILAPTCFGSRRNHHQGAALFLAKTTKLFFCARRYRRSQCYGGICCRNIDSWNNKSVFDTIDARCKYEDYIITDIQVMVFRILGRNMFEMCSTLQHTLRPKKATSSI